MKYIKIGKIINTHALKGEMKIELYTDFSLERFKKGNKLKIDLDNLSEEVIIKSFRLYKKFAYIVFEGYEDINLVEKFKGLDLFISQEYIKNLEDGYYFFQLKGLKCFDQQNNFIGDVIDVYEGIKHNNLVILHDKKYMVPINDFFIKKIDLNDKKIIINLIEGLK